MKMGKEIICNQYNAINVGFSTSWEYQTVIPGFHSESCCHIRVAKNLGLGALMYFYISCCKC